jgi:hypothetical protein
MHKNKTSAEQSPKKSREERIVGFNSVQVGQSVWEVAKRCGGPDVSYALKPHGFFEWLIPLDRLVVWGYNMAERGEYNREGKNIDHSVSIVFGRGDKKGQENVIEWNH